MIVAIVKGWEAWKKISVRDRVKGLESGAVRLVDLRRSAARVLWMVRQNSILACK